MTADPDRNLPRSERLRQLRDLLGSPDSSVHPLTRAIRATTHRSFDRHVVPIARRHWPGVFSEPFGRKLRFLACDLYASAPYTVLFCASNRPLSIQLAAVLANAVPLPRTLLARIAGLAMRAIGCLAFQNEHRRIILIAAFIAAIDHAFDHCMSDPPQERGRKLRALLDGSRQADTPPLALTRGLQEAMSQRLRAHEREPFDAALERVKQWIDAEVKALSGDEDTAGLGHRIAGVEGTIDGLIFPVYRYAGERSRRWMYDVSLFIQMMDDWIDFESDLETERTTPVITGHWTIEDLRELWETTVRGIEELTRESGLRAPHYVGFVRDAYVTMLHEVMEAMVRGIAD